MSEGSGQSHGDDRGRGSDEPTVAGAPTLPDSARISKGDGSGVETDTGDFSGESIDTTGPLTRMGTVLGTPPYMPTGPKASSSSPGRYGGKGGHSGRALRPRPHCAA